jgi:hypothetical protein
MLQGNVFRNYYQDDGRTRPTRPAAMPSGATNVHGNGRQQSALGFSARVFNSVYDPCSIEIRRL